MFQKNIDRTFCHTQLYLAASLALETKKSGLALQMRFTIICKLITMFHAEKQVKTVNKFPH